MHVKPGQTVAKEEVMLTLESDKATLDVPAPEAGVIGEMKVKVGDKVSQGALLATVRRSGGAAAAAGSGRREARGAAPPAAEGRFRMRGGRARRRAGRLHRRVPRRRPRQEGRAGRARPTLGGVCLNVGCIPSKALLHVG